MVVHFKEFVPRVIRVIVCVLLLAAAAAVRGRLFGRDLAKTRVASEGAAQSAVQTMEDGVIVVNSSSLAPGVSGYGGPVPVEVTVKDGQVFQIRPVLPNDETPMFFGTLEAAGFWKRWDNLPLSVAVTSRFDAVTGATYSSEAALANIRAALAAAADIPPPAARGPAIPSSKTLAALAVLLASALLPLFTRSRGARTALLVLDIAVLGIWNGFFLSHARLVGWAGSCLPMDPVGLLGALLLLAMAFVYPLFGRPQHYCLQTCPFGAAQELAGRIPVHKWRLPPRLVHALTVFRRALWGVLMLLLWTGLASAWLDWELFAAFSFRAAPPLVTAFALATLVLAVFVPRPYCRFACPTGTLLKLSETFERE